MKSEEPLRSFLGFDTAEARYARQQLTTDAAPFGRLEGLACIGGNVSGWSYRECLRLECDGARRLLALLEPHAQEVRQLHTEATARGPRAPRRLARFETALQRLL